MKAPVKSLMIIDNDTDSSTEVQKLSVYDGHLNQPNNQSTLATKEIVILSADSRMWTARQSLTTLVKRICIITRILKYDVASLSYF